MTDTFVPLTAVKSTAPSDPGFSAMAGKGATPQVAPAATASAGPVAAPAGACAKPVVTLQRQGDVVSSIRIQCGCGQVIELNCVY